ncbi:MAG: peptidoglycan D,D-transpeptidase FtsI family protein [Anaerolineae bacterium]
MDIQEQTRNRIYAMMAVLLAIALVLVGQLIRWQVVEHQTFVRLAEAEHQRQLPLRAQRGEIYDRNGFLLAADTVRYEIAVNPPMIDDPELVADRLHPLLEMPRQELLTLLTSDKPWLPLTRNAPRSVGDTLQEWDLVGLEIKPHSKRIYPEGTLAAHILGFVNDNDNGFYGVEGYYDTILRGKPGFRSGERGPFGDIIPLGTEQYAPPQRGASLTLTIDRTIQHLAERELAYALDVYDAESGTILIMNPRTGAILAAASLPAYDPNNFAQADSDLFQDPVVSRQYEPGSVFKILTMAAGLDSGVVTPGTTLYDAGIIEVGGRTIYNWDRQAYGTVDMTTLLAKSLNVSAAQIAIMMGKDRFYTYLRRFGLGHISGVDLASEGPGTMKTPLDADWYESDLGTNSFGQGIAVTPLQMAAAVAAIANDGLLMKPHVVQAISDNGQVLQVKPTVIRRAVSADTANILTQMLARALVMENSAALLPGYQIAGKTGTAEIPVPGGYHPFLTVASFIGYFPVDDPQILALVILHRPKTSRWGTQTAAPTFQRLAGQLVRVLDIPPDEIRVARQ